MRISTRVIASFVGVFLLAPSLCLAIAPGADAPALELPLFKSTTPFKLADYKGKQAVVLEFGQSACGSCKGMSDFLAPFQGKSKNYEIVKVNVDMMGGSEKWNKLMETITKDEKVQMKMAIDPKFTAGPLFGIRATPGIAVIDKEGKFVGSLVGFDDTMKKEISDLIDKVK